MMVQHYCWYMRFYVQLLLVNYLVPVLEVEALRGYSVILTLL